jgi:hypothetical protein
MNIGMNDNMKKALLVFGGGALLFYVLRYVFKIKDDKEQEKIEEKKEENKPKTLSADGGEEEFAGQSAKESREKQKNAIIIKKAFVDAIKDKQPKSFLNEMNAEFAKDFKMKVYKSKTSGKLFVADLQGNVIID